MADGRTVRKLRLQECVCVRNASFGATMRICMAYMYVYCSADIWRDRVFNSDTHTHTVPKLLVSSLFERVPANQSSRRRWYPNDQPGTLGPCGSGVFVHMRLDWMAGLPRTDAWFAFNRRLQAIWLLPFVATNLSNVATLIIVLILVPTKAQLKKPHIFPHMTAYALLLVLPST